MGDYSNFNLTAWSSDTDALQAIRDFCINGDYSGTYVYHDDMEPGVSYSYGANEVSLGSVDQAAGGLLRLIKEGVEEYTCPVCHGTGKRPDSGDDCLRCVGEGCYTLPVKDFPFLVHDEPEYEWMGTIIIHVPGLPDFEGECDSDGNVQLSANKLMAMVDKATDLDGLRQAIARKTGSAHRAAIEAGTW